MKKRLTTGLAIVSLVMAMLPGLATAGARVEICHVVKYLPATRTLEVSAAAVPAHLAHGDYLGRCVIIPVPPR